MNGSYNTREIALIILKQINYDGKYSNFALKNELKRYSLPKRDTAFITQLVYGTLERQITLDWVLGNFTKIKKKNPWLINILRMGCYQILYLDRVPDSAACNEAVELTKKYVTKSLSGYVNGVLRNISRNVDNIKKPSIEKDPITYFMVEYSCPRWLCNMWYKQYGLDHMHFILDSVALKDITTLRVNSIKTDKTELIYNLDKLGINGIEEGLYMHGALRIRNIGNIEGNLQYIRGNCAIQSESSMLSVTAMDVMPGEHVLDACSAPGGKACYMAQIMNNVGIVDAWDIHPHRVALIEKNAKRLGTSIVRAREKDATVPSDTYRKLYDKVLLDVPCSGLGMMHKKPDIKLRITEKGIQKIIDIQRDILNTCANYVKPDGILIYSTCTINRDENENIIYEFLDTRTDFELDEISSFMPEALKKNVKSRGMIQILPGRDDIDGFFIARLRRKS